MDLTQKLNRETSKIAWRELQRFFAGGKAVFVDDSLDLIQTARQFAEDNSTAIEALMDTGQLGLVNDKTAKTWFDNDTVVWAVVVRPWVLVQRVDD